MKRWLGAGILLVMLMGMGQLISAQAGATSHADAPAQNVVSADSGVRNPAKQLALQAQIDRLVSMATELREQVDKTNKNILSVKVVRKAEEIEVFAKRMKEQGRK